MGVQKKVGRWVSAWGKCPLWDHQVGLLLVVMLTPAAVRPPPPTLTAHPGLSGDPRNLANPRVRPSDTHTATGRQHGAGPSPLGAAAVVVAAAAGAAIVGRPPALRLHPWVGHRSLPKGHSRPGGLRRLLPKPPLLSRRQGNNWNWLPAAI